MHDESAAMTLDAPDTIPPPPETVPPLALRKKPKSERRLKTYPVTIPCESEEQRAMLIDWLAEAGFEVEPRP